jgi:hypothetical protein
VSLVASNRKSRKTQHDEFKINSNKRKEDEGVSELDERMYAFISLNDVVGSSGDSDSFDEVLGELDQILPMRITNTLLLNFWMLDDEASKDYDGDLGKDIIRRLFEENINVDYIVWLCPMKAKILPSTEKLFKRLDISSRPVIKKRDPLRDMKVYYLDRAMYLPKLFVREARVEDNDDLIPIIARNNPAFLEGQDSFFLADLINSQDERNKLFVSVHDQKTVGMLATSAEVNVPLIIKIFDLETFPEMIIPKEPTPLPYPEIFYFVGDSSVITSVFQSDATSYLNVVFIDANEVLQSVGSVEESTEEKAEQACTLLKGAISDMLEKPEYMGSNTPHACIVLGFPRTDDEAVFLANGKLPINAILEIDASSSRNYDFASAVSSKEVAKGPATDPLAQIHADSLETLREALEEQNEAGSGTKVVLRLRDWHKLHLTDNANAELLYQMQKLIAPRIHKIESQRLLDENEPPITSAFAVTAFCLEPDYESRAQDMLRIAFEEHSEYTYCIFMVPDNSPPSRLTEGMVMAQVKPGVSFDQTLFLIHRESLVAQESLRMERLLKEHMVDLVKFVEPLEVAGEEVMGAIDFAIRENDVNLKDNPADVCFILRMENRIVGLVDLSRRVLSGEDVHWMCANYRVEDFISFEKHRLRSQATITRWVMSPAIVPWTRFVLREAMRKYQKTVLYYQCPEKVVPPKELLEQMIPIRPRLRTQPRKGVQEAPPLVDRPSAGAPGRNCPIFTLSKPMVSQSKNIVNTRIVIVGGNASTYAILETLCMVPDFHLENITLVIEDLPGFFKPDRIIYADRDIYNDPSSPLSPRSPKHDNLAAGSNDEGAGGFFGCLSPNDIDCLHEQELLALGLSHRITVIKGGLTDIDRENRAIVISDEVVIEYDILMMAPPSRDNSAQYLPSTKKLKLSACALRGVFGLGTVMADAAALKWIRGRTGTSNDTIVIYGCGIDPFVAAGNLLHYGCSPSRITLVLEDAELEETGDVAVNDLIIEVLDQIGVRVLWGFLLHDVEFMSRGPVQSAIIQSMYPEDEFKAEDKFTDPMLSRGTDKSGGLDDADIKTEGSGRSFDSDNKDDYSESKRLGADSKGSYKEGLSSKDTSRVSTAKRSSRGSSRKFPRGEGLTTEKKTIICHALLCCRPKQCDVQVFEAINESGLVYDGGLVVDETFRTTDPFIYAVGDFTRFSRMYQNAVPHCEYNPRELGIFAAINVLKSYLDPLSGYVDYSRPPTSDGKHSYVPVSINRLPSASKSNRKKIPVAEQDLPIFVLPRTKSMRLPGGYELVTSIIPRRAKEIEAETQTISLLTGGVEDDRCCVVKVNSLGTITEFTYIGQELIEERNIARVVGWQEAYLNGAVRAYEQGQVDDWVEYFRENWVSAILHDRFSDFTQGLRRTLQTDKGTFMVVEGVMEGAFSTSEDSILAEARRKIIGDDGIFLPDLTKKSIQDFSMDYLRKNRGILNKFYVPSIESKDAKAEAK